MTFKSRTDLNIDQVPSPVPVMGPAGSVVVDPSFNNRIVRLTDERTMPEHPLPGSAFYAGVGGSADVCVWNTDSTLLSIEDSGGGGVIMSFDPVSFAVKRVFPGWRHIGPCIFSKANPNIIFNLSGTQYLKYDLSDRTASVPPPPTVVCDFAGQLPGKYTWKTIGGVENNDTVFAAAYSTTGGQNTGIYACVFTVGKGYRTWNTQTGEITGDWGFLGQVYNPDRFIIHNVKLSKGTATWLVVERAAPLAPKQGGAYFWSHDGLQVKNIGSIAWGGHWVMGVTQFFNCDSSTAFSIPYWAHVKRSIASINTPVKLATSSPTPSLMVPLDDHLSFNGPPGSIVLSCSANVVPQNAPLLPFPAAWYNEILGFDVNTGVVYRFCHTFCSGNTGNFYADNAIGAGDQKNKFVCWSSDWMKQLGRASDVFIAELT